jgi:hypothetical protein
MTKEIQNRKLRFFTKLKIEDKILIFRNQKNNFYILKDKYKNTDLVILTYCSFLISIDRYLQNLSEIEQDIINQQKVSLIHFSKRDKIISKWAVIRELKLKNNMSFRQIVKFLNKKYKLNISLSSLYNIWKELENNNQKQGEKNG